MTEAMRWPELAPSSEKTCLNRLSASQQPPSLLRMLHERARWFHEYPTCSPVLMSLERQGTQPKAEG